MVSLTRLPRVLIIDDEPHSVEFLQKAFGAMNPTCLVSMARTTDEGFRMALASKYDLIVCDIRFNGETGLQLGARMQAEPKLNGTRKVIYTDKPIEDGDLERARAAGFVAYVRKPMDPWEHAKDILMHLRMPTSAR